MNVEFNWWYSKENKRYECSLNLFKDDGEHFASYHYIPEYADTEVLLGSFTSIIRALDRELDDKEKASGEQV